jgi:hypothetical protein
MPLLVVNIGRLAIEVLPYCREGSPANVGSPGDQV